MGLCIDNYVLVFISSKKISLPVGRQAFQVGGGKKMPVFCDMVSHYLKLLQIGFWISLCCFVGSLAQAHASYQRRRAASYATNKG
jgi:hypothetical protein